MSEVKGQGSEVTDYQPNSLNQYTSISNSMLSAPCPLLYNLNGNLTNDGVRAYTWDTQNQLVSVQDVGIVEGSIRVDFAYDFMGRRISKKVYTRISDVWSLTSDLRFVYDGLNFVSEVRSQGSEVSTNFYTWGNDLSGSLHGAGGVGGLLAQSQISNGSSEIATYYVAYDHNGNVEKVLTRSGAVVAAFQYDAFGNTISETIAQGLTPNAFSFRFSTKYWDSETGLYYYGYRYYSPKKGRWLSRDPIAENGGVNLYGFVGNNGVFKIDLLGLYDILIISDGSCDAGDFLDEVQGVVDTVANACCEEFGLGCGKINVKESDTGIPDNEFLKPNDGSYSLSQEQRTCLVAGNMAVANGANIGVVITANSLHGNSVGVNYDTQGIIITSGNINGIPHEAGHAGGYTDPSNPDDPSHSGDDDHVMDSPDSGAGVDIRYCCSVFGGED